MPLYHFKNQHQHYLCWSALVETYLTLITHPTCVLSSAGNSHPFPITLAATSPECFCPDSEHSLVWDILGYTHSLGGISYTFDQLMPQRLCLALFLFISGKKWSRFPFPHCDGFPRHFLTPFFSLIKQNDELPWEGKTPLVCLPDLWQVSWNPSVISAHTGSFPSAHAGTQNIHKDDIWAVEHPGECVAQLPTPHIRQRVSSATSEIHELLLCY